MDEIGHHLADTTVDDDDDEMRVRVERGVGRMVGVVLCFLPILLTSAHYFDSS